MEGNPDTIERLSVQLTGMASLLHPHTLPPAALTLLKLMLREVLMVVGGEGIKRLFI